MAPISTGKVENQFKPQVCEKKTSSQARPPWRSAADQLKV